MNAPADNKPATWSVETVNGMPTFRRYTKADKNGIFPIPEAAANRADLEAALAVKVGEMVSQGKARDIASYVKSAERLICALTTD
jgi:hypothetical protein